MPTVFCYHYHVASEAYVIVSTANVQVSVWRQGISNAIIIMLCHSGRMAMNIVNLLPGGTI